MRVSSLESRFIFVLCTTILHQCWLGEGSLCADLEREVHDNSELYRCVHCANTDTHSHYVCKVKEHLQLANFWEDASPEEWHPPLSHQNNHIIIRDGANVKITGAKAGGGVAQIKGALSFRLFFIEQGAQVVMERLDLRNGLLPEGHHTQHVSPPAPRSCTAWRRC